MPEPIDPRSAALLDAGDALELAPLAPVPLPAVADLLMPGEPPVGVRVYTPDVIAPRGALVWLHPGGFVAGDIDDIDGVCRTMAAEGRCTVLSVDYRLAPAHPFPAAVEDTLAVLAWLREHAGTLGVDAERIAVGGQSAGATIAAGALLRMRDAGCRLPALQVLAYPVLDSRFDTASWQENDGKLLTYERSSENWRQYLGGAPPSAYAAPLRADDLAGLPPALLFAAGHDPWRDDARRFAVRLTDAGVPSELVEYGGALHAFLSFPAVLPVARAALDVIAARLRDTLGDPKPRLQHVGLTYPPGREAEVRAFYGGVLGLAEKPTPAVLSDGGYVWFAAGPGEGEIHLIAHASAAGDGPRHACLTTDRLDEVIDRLTEAGCDVERHDAIAGRPQAFFHDPFGNVLELSRLVGPYA